MKVKFFPKQDITAIKCNHRFGAKMTFSHQTDSRYQSSIYALELYGFKNNVRPGCFATNLLGQYNDDIDITEATGLMRHDIYFGVDYWQNPNTGILEVIPDYYGTQWTANGALYFNVTPGATKTARTPSHGQMMFDLSGGALGYDFVNGVMGANNLMEVIAVEESQQDWLHSVVGRYPSSGSYRVGDNRGALTHLNRWLGFRNSSPSPTVINVPAPTQYGSMLGYPEESTNRELFINYRSSCRWWDGWAHGTFPKQDVSDYMSAQLALTLANEGWYRDFGHTHSMRNNGNIDTLDEFFGIFRTAVDGEFVWTCSNGEAVEYLFVRELCKRIGATDSGQSVVLVADIVDDFKELSSGGMSQALPLNRINIPLSVEVDLTGTSLEGKDIVASSGKCISLGSNKYVAQIPFNQKELFQSVTLIEGEDGYFNTSVPTATTDISGGQLTVTCDMPCKAVLFSVSEGGEIYDSLPASRSNTYSSTHSFNITTGNDYRVGIISEFFQANLITV